jgi:hypothetical protein
MNKVIKKDCSQGANLQQLILYSLAQDDSLPSFPIPSYANLVDNIIEKAALGNKNLDPDRLRQAVLSLEPELENKFRTQVSGMMRYLSSRNWFTSQLRMRYLSYRGPLCDMSQVAILSSPAENQISAAAYVLHKLATAITSLDTVYAIGSDRKGNHFETQQLRDIFATTRIPGHEQDVLKTSPKSSHVVVFSNGHIFRVGILDRESRPLPVSVLARQIQKILHISSANPTTNNIALFSTLMGRKSWAELRHHYMSVNPEAIDDIESALASVALHTTLDSSQEENLKLAKEDKNCVYSDKVLGLSVFPDGTIVARIDHSVADGGLLVLLWQYLSSVQEKADRHVAQEILDIQSPKEIHLGNESLGHSAPIQGPTVLCNSVISKIPQDPKLSLILRYTKLSHAIYLFAYQATLVSLFDESDCSIHEPVSTRRYAEGRCDRHYVTTEELLSFCRSLKENKPLETLVSDFKKALQKYKTGLEATRNGQGFGATIAVLEKSMSSMEDSNRKNLMMEAINTFKKRGALFTGFPFAPAVDAVEGFVSAPDRVSCVYLGHESEFILCLTGSGMFFDLLPRIKELMEQNISNITQVVLNSGLVRDIADVRHDSISHRIIQFGRRGFEGASLLTQFRRTTLLRTAFCLFFLAGCSFLTWL